MEIILDNVTYISNNYEDNLNNINYTFKNGITFVKGLNAKILKELLLQEKKCKEGFVGLDKRGKIYDVAFISEDNKYKKETLYEEIVYLNEYYKINYKNIEKRISDALKMANIDNTILIKKFKEMTLNELKLCSLIIALFLNAKILILDYFEKNLPYSNINYIKKLLYKLNKMYNKNIIIFSNDLDSYLNIIKNIVIFKNGKIVFSGTNKDLYKNELYKNIDEPDIIKFIKYLNNNGHDFDEYIDIKELLKAIYRDVENK